MIWLIGKSGLLGQEIAQMLEQEKLLYIGTGHEVDITDINELKKFADEKTFSWIINCAAYTAVDNAENDFENACKLNHHALTNLALIAKEKNAKVIHISTDYVFDGKKNNKYTEEDIPNPLNIYGKSKYAGESELMKWNKSFILRISWLFGHNKNNFVKTMLNLFNSKEELKIINDQFGLPTYTKDLAQLIKIILHKNCNQYGVFHFCNSGEKISWFNFASEIYLQARNIGLINKDVKITPIPTIDYKQTALRPHNSCLSTKKIELLLQISIPSWQNALERFFEIETSLQ